MSKGVFRADLEQRHTELIDQARRLEATEHQNATGTIEADAYPSIANGTQLEVIVDGEKFEIGEAVELTRAAIFEVETVLGALPA